jgi:glycosyltransferase involved in cell wall biosynthesis
MKLGVVIDGNTRFISELLDDWKSRFQVEIFAFDKLTLPALEDRINRWRYTRRLSEFLERNDVVFFEWAGEHLAAAAKLRTSTPLVARLHSWELFDCAERIDWGAVSRVILVSGAMRQAFVSRFPGVSGKTEVISPGKALPVSLAPPRRFAGRLGVLCDLVPVKRLYDLVLSLYDLRCAGYDLTLHVGGREGKGAENRRYVESLKRLVARLGFSDRVVFHGWVEDTAAWLSDIDIFVSNSYWEGLQNALVEAMAAGCYCLSHAWGGAEEVLPERFIYVTPAELHRKLTAFCDLPESAKWAHRSELRELVRNRFDMESMLSRTRSTIEAAHRHRRSGWTLPVTPRLKVGQHS